MFKFGFSSDRESDEQKQKAESVQWIQCKKVLVENQDILERLLQECEVLSNKFIKHLSPKDVINELEDTDHSINPVLNAEKCHSDLLPAVYEGGMKIWECSFDLCEFIDSNIHDLKGKRVLDLGCGAGIVGIFCLLKGASCCFQDYNEEVIKYITIPNVMLNQQESGMNFLNESSFYSGDWNSFVNVVACDDQRDKFDYIFTSETIYNIENYDKLHHVFQQCLKKDGVVYLAAKSYYFGVGGSISEFINLLNKKNVFEYVNCWKCSDGVNREILKIKFKT